MRNKKAEKDWEQKNKGGGEGQEGMSGKPGKTKKGWWISCTWSQVPGWVKQFTSLLFSEKKFIFLSLAMYVWLFFFDKTKAFINKRYKLLKRVIIFYTKSYKNIILIFNLNSLKYRYFLIILFLIKLLN